MLSSNAASPKAGDTAGKDHTSFKGDYPFALCNRFCLKYAFNCSKFMSAISNEILSLISRMLFTASNVFSTFFVFAFILLCLLVNEFLMAENQV